MTQDNTKDPVRVLRELQRYEESSMEGGGVAPYERGEYIKLEDAITALAAIPHSEQRETVAAGEDEILQAAQKRMWEALDRRACPGAWMQIASDAIFGCQKDSYGEVIAAPVAAPVPEAEDELDHGETVLRIQGLLGITQTGWVSPDLLESLITRLQRKAAAPVPEARPHVLTWKHAANEWADTAYNGLQHIRNIKDGITTSESALENMTKCCAYAHEVADSVREIDAAVATVPEAKAEQNSSSSNLSMSGAEAKAEQVGCPACGIAGIHACPGAPIPEWTPEKIAELDAVLAQYETEPPAAPAVKHEASELPPLATWSYSESLSTMVPDSPRGANRQRYYRVEDVDALLAAPPIAVQGSIGEDAEFGRLMLAYRRYQNEATWKPLIDYIDSRSPVAAAPDTARLDFVLKNSAWIQWVTFDSTFTRAQLCTQNEDEEYVMLSGEDKSYSNEREAIDAARALSAAAPSADAKGGAA